MLGFQDMLTNLANWIGDISGVLRNYVIEFSNDETNFQEFYFKAIKRACNRGMKLMLIEGKMVSAIPCRVTVVGYRIEAAQLIA